MWHAYVNNPWIFVEKKPQSICTLVTRGTLSHVKPPFSLLAANMWPLSASFCPRIVCPFQTEDRKYVGRILYEPSPRERGFSRFYNPHSASVKSFVMKQTKARSWSGMPLSRVHNLHSLYSSTRGMF